MPRLLPLAASIMLGLVALPLAASGKGPASESAAALTAEDIPNPRERGSWVADVAEVLSPEEQSALDDVISSHERRSGDEIAVVTVPRVVGDVKDFATALFQRWAIGKRGRDNGVLVVASIGQRRIEIETGYGVEDALPDAFVGEVARTIVAPRFRDGDYGGGLLLGVRAIVDRRSAASGDEPPRAADPVDAPSDPERGWWIALSVFAALVLARVWLWISDRLRVPDCIRDGHRTATRTLLRGAARRKALSPEQRALERSWQAHHRVARCASCGSLVVIREGIVRTGLRGLLVPVSLLGAALALLAKFLVALLEALPAGSSTGRTRSSWSAGGGSSGSSSSGGFGGGGSSGGGSFGGGQSGGGGAGSSW